MEEILKTNKPKAPKSVKTTVVKAKTTTVKKKVTENPSDPYPITLNKQEIKRVIEMFKGTKTTPKTSVGKIAEILKVNKKQVLRVLHKNELKTYKESSLR